MKSVRLATTTGRMPMPAAAFTLSAQEVERLNRSLQRREPGRVAPEVLDRVVSWAALARQQNRSPDLTLLDSVLSGEFEVYVLDYDRPGGGHASDPRLMFWSPPPPLLLASDQQADPFAGSAFAQTDDPCRHRRARQERTDP